MSALALLSHLREKQIKLFVDGGKLKFHAPKGALNNELKGKISAAKEEIIALLTKLQNTGNAAQITRHEQLEFPLSHAQKRLWLIDNIDGGSSQYNVTAALKLTGVLNQAVLERAFSQLIERHHVLRTTYHQNDLGVVQRVNSAPTFSLPLVQVDDQGQEIIAEQKSLPFDLSRDLLIRGRLLELSEQNYLLVVTMHHIASDGWSIGILAAELSKLYNAALTNSASCLDELAFQYGDFAVWQGEQAQVERINHQLTYWKNHLQNSAPLLELQQDKLRPAQVSSRGALVRKCIEPQLSNAFKELCNSYGVTLFMGLQALQSLLFCRLSGEREILLGTPYANRQPEETQSLIGFFVNTLVLKTPVDLQAGFSSLLEQAKKVSLAAFNHSEVPFEVLIEQLVEERDLGYSPLIQHLLVVQNNDVNESNLTEHVHLEGLSVELMTLPTNTSIYDTVTEFTETKDGLHIRLEYSTDLFDEQRIGAWLQSLELIMSAVVRSPDTPVGSLNFVDEDARKQVERFSHGDELILPLNTTLSGHFEAQVNKTPNAIALCHRGQNWSYATLNAEANRFAHWLLSQGIRPSSRVGICQPRGKEMVVSVLAILKLGCAYVPMDASLPQRRIMNIANSAKLAITLATGACSDNFSDELPVVLLEDIRGQLDTQPTNNLTIALPEDPPAYMLYSSGTTGRPKGILMGNQALCNLIFAMQHDHPDMARPQINIQLASIGFDMSFSDLCSMFLCGGKCVLIEQDDVHELPRLVNYIQDYGVTVLNLPYAMLQSLCDYVVAEQVILPTLTTIFSTAEALKITPAIRRFFSAHSGCQLFNHYGPTETHVVTSLALTGDPQSWPEIPSIGKPLANVQCHILDDNMQPLPIGVSGELYIGGKALAHGYFEQPQLNEAKFLEKQSVMGRLYRTGDWATWQQDGTIRYVGRRDGLIKLRGFRIELAEIEQCLSQHEMVTDVVVVCRGEGESKYLVAFYTTSPGTTLCSIELANKLRKSLPSYMIPSNFVHLDKMPLNVNGKVDKRELPNVSAHSQAIAGEAPATNAEAQLLEIWQRLIKNPAVGVTDNFFMVGGNSLLLSQLVHSVHREAGIELSVKALFEQQNIRDVLQSQCEALPKIEMLAHDLPTELSYGQYRILIIEHLTGPSTVHNMPGGALVKGAVDLSILKKALNVLAKRHHMLNTRLCRSSQAEQLQEYDPDYQHTIAYLDLSLRTSDTVDAQRKAHGETLFNLYKLPLCQFSLVKMADQEYEIWVNFHHLICDGWSVRLFITEWLNCYEQLIQGTEPEIHRQVQYRDYAQWQRQLLTSKLADEQRAFWRKYLDAAPANLTFPFEKSCTADNRFIGGVYNMSVPKQTLQQLEQLASRHGGTLFNVLHSALVVLFSRLTTQRDIVIGVPVTGRHVPGVEHLLGMLLNNLPLRSQLSLDCSFESLLEQQIDNARQVFSAQDTPFEMILEQVQIERDTSTTPLFQVMLNVLNLPEAQQQCPSLQVEQLDWTPEQSKFNMNFYMEPTDQGLNIKLSYNSARFSAGEIERMVHQYIHLLVQITKAPHVKCCDMALSDACNNLQLEQPAAWPGSICEQLSEQCLLRPKAHALVCGPERLTYIELQQRINAMVKGLKQHGIQKGDVVSVIATRDINFVVSLFSILYSGAAFHLINDRFPIERVKEQLCVTNSRLIVGPRPDIWDDSLPTVINMAADCLGEAHIPDINAIDQHTLAYIAFTSGTEGKPKAIEASHGSLNGVLMPLIQEYALGPEMRFGQLSSITHDPILRDIFIPLSIGACLYIPTDTQYSQEQLSDWLREHSINSINVTPTMANLIASNAECLQNLQRVFICGEQVTAAIIERLEQCASDAWLVNLYGATETARAICHFLATESNTRDNHIVPIGKGLPGVSAIVLNEQLRRCDDGEVGQIAIFSPYLSLGYRGNEQDTAQKFVTIEGRKAYLTGDLGRVDIHGELHCLGRKDRQVKVSGYRIEPGEVETAVMRYRDVTACAVILINGDGQPPHLAAVVQSANSALHADDITLWLRKQLPYYMVPAQIVVTERLPITVNGKTDLAAAMALCDASLAVRKPETETEGSLVFICAQLLGCEPDSINLNASFFALGGHSLLATKLINEVKANLGVELSMQSFFSANNLHALATQIDALFVQLSEEQQLLLRATNKKEGAALITL